MKKVLYSLIFVLIIFVSRASADSFGDYSIVINEDYSYNVYLGGYTSNTPTTDYPDFFDFEDGVVTLHEGARIIYLCSAADITITSNDKPVSIYYMQNNTYSGDAHFTIRNLHNDYIGDHNGGFNMIGSYMSLEVYDSYFKSAYLQFYDTRPVESGKDRLILDNVTIEEIGAVVSYNGLSISDSDLNVTDVEEWRTNMYINNSTIKTSADVANYSTTPLETKIIDSDIQCSRDNCFMGNGNGPSNSGKLYIENSHIKNYYIENMKGTYGNESYTKIINTSFENLNNFASNCPIYISNSEFDIGRLYNSSNDVYNTNNGVFIENSKLNIQTFTAMGNISVDNSYIETNGLIFNQYPVINSLNVKDSYVRLNTDNSPSLLYGSNVSIRNSNFFAETNVDYVFFTSRSSSDWTGANIEIDNYLKLIDKNDVELHLLGLGDLNTSNNMYNTYVLAYDGDETYSQSLKIISKANVIFKVKNGTWEDGTTDDIVVTKDVWTKLSSDEIPTGMIGDTEGSWEIEPNAEDYIKGNITYVYKFKKKGIVKGIIEELTENPKTGVFRYSFITLVLLCISILVYRRLTFNRYFKYK